MTYKARVYISYSIMEKHFVLEDTVQVSIAYSEGVLLGRVNVTSSRSFKRPTTFDFELEGKVGGGGGGSGERWENHLSHPLSFVLTASHPLGINYFFSLAFCCCKNQRWQLLLSSRKFCALAR